jgi:PAS domain S-box-containing protein
LFRVALLVRRAVFAQGPTSYRRRIAIDNAARRLEWPAVMLGVGTVYVLAGKLGLHFAFVHVSASPVWPPTGIALAAFLVLGARVWPAIFVGALVVNITSAGALASLGIATGNTLEGFLGALLVNRYAGGRAAFERPYHIFKFAVWAGLLSTMVSATFGVTALVLAGRALWIDYVSIWVTWWLGDAAGCLVVTPLAVLWVQQRDLAVLRRRPLEVTALAVALVLVGQVVFGGWGPLELRNVPTAFLSIPILLWAVFRFGPWGTATAIGGLCAIAVSGTLNGYGPFATGTPNTSLLLLQAFMATMSTTMLPVAALVWERRGVEESLRHSNERHRIAIEAGQMGTWEWTIATGAVQWSPGLERIHGLAPGTFPGTFQAVIDETHPDDRDALRSAVTQALERGGRYQIEYRILRPDGTVCWVEGRGTVLRDEWGRAERMVGVCTDVTERKHRDQERAKLLAEEQAARLRAEEAERRLAFLGEIAGSITSSLDLDTVLQRIVEGAKDLSHGDAAALLLRDESQAMVPRYRVGTRLGTFASLRIEPGQGLGGQVMVTGRPARTWHDLADPRAPVDLHSVAREAGPVSLMVVPITIEQRVEGLLYIAHAVGRTFGDEDEAICLRLAGQAAVAIQNATLFTREHSRRSEAEAVTEIAKALTEGLDPDMVAQRAADEARTLLRAVTTAVFRLEAEDGNLVAVAISGSTGPGFSIGGRLAQDEGTEGRAIQRRRPVITPNVLTDPEIRLEDISRRWMEQAPYRAALAVPLTVKGTIIGVFAAGDREGRVFTPEDVRMAQSFAEHAAIALENARLFTREQAMRAGAEAAERRAAFLAEASGVLGSSLDYTTTLPTVARLAVPTFADWCIVDLLTRDGGVDRVAVAAADATIQRALQQIQRYVPDWKSQQPAARVFRSGRTVVFPEVTEETLTSTARDDAHLALMRELKPRSAMCVPLLARQRIVGALTFVRGLAGPAYATADVAVAEELAHRVALAVDNAALYSEAEQARGQAEAANRAKDEFLAVLSHELRTPMNAVYGWARMLQGGRLDAGGGTRAIDAIVRNAHAQTQLIDDLLDVSRIATGKMRLEVRSVDLPAVLGAALDAVRPAADAKEIRLRTVMDPRAGPVNGDPDRLQQVVWNLLMNAVKFTPRGGRVQLSLQRVNSHVEIVVSDTGLGIRAEVLPFVFERFRQGDSSSTRAQAGLGIGLALVRHLVELHGGTVIAESAGEGQGATFRATLPLAITQADLASDRVPAVAGELPPAYTRPSLQGVRVMIVDDDPDALGLISAMLTTASAEVSAHGTAAEALAQLREWRPHVLVSDIEMPGEDGYSLIRRVRALAPSEGGRTPAIALTAYGRPEDRIRSLAAGYSIHVPKPVDPAELGVVVANLAARSHDG